MDVTVISGVGPERGLGAQLALRFAQDNMHILVAGRTQSKLDYIVKMIKKGVVLLRRS